MVSTPATHALVIGTSKYKHLPIKPRRLPDRETFLLPQVQSPAVGAYLFAKWLQEDYYCPTAPLNSLELLASPSDEEKDFYPDLSNAVLSNTQNVRKALISWWKRCNSHTDNVAILYLSGHGVQVRKDLYYVLLEDFAEDELILSFSVDVKAVFDGMVGKTMARKQFYFIDACRANVTNFVDQFYGNGLGLPRLHDGNDIRIAPIIGSAAPGTVAFAPLMQAPLFSQALIESLKDPGSYVASPGEVKTISYLSLVDAVQNRLDKLAANYDKDQYLILSGLTRNTTFQVISPKSVEKKVNVGIESAMLPAQLEALGPSSLAVELKDVNRPLPSRTESTGEILNGLRIIQTSEFLENRISKRLVKKFGYKLDSRDEFKLESDPKVRGGWWWWVLSIEGPEIELDSIQRVEYKLHETFGDKPYKRTANKYRKTNFSLEKVGWGGFDLTAKIVFKDKTKQPITLSHELKLFFPNGERCWD